MASFPTRALPVITSLALLVGLACSNDDEPLPTGTTGAAGKAGAGTGGTNAGGASAGTGGTNAGGASAGTGGTNAGGASAGTGGTNAGGASAGTGGTNAGGASAGAAGTSAGAAGANAGGAGAGTGGTNAGGASAGSGGGTLACVLPPDAPRACTTGADCAVVRGASLCNVNYVGLQKGSAASYESAAALYRTCAPPPPCAANLPDRADDGSVPLAEGAQPTVRCDVGQCRSSFIQDCTQVPSFGTACTQASDCVAVDQPDCCTTRVKGIAAADAQLASSTFTAFVDSCRACEEVDCAGGGRMADDDSTPPVGMPNAAAKLLCEGGQCRTTFK